MGPELLLAIITTLVSLIGGGLAINAATEKVVRKLVYRVFGRKEPEPSYAERLNTLSENIRKSFNEMDTMLAELAGVTREKKLAMERVEQEVVNLQNQERELQERIEHLQNLPLPVAEHFANLTLVGEKRSARRDYVLFGTGVIVSTLIAIGLRLLGFA